MLKRYRTAAAAAVAVIGMLFGTAPALAAADPTRLGLSAVGQTSPFFDLTMAPGSVRSLSVDLVNSSTGSIPALTYSADVYTIVNGGLGIALRGTTGTATTTWLSYPTQTMVMQAGATERRTFTVSVPAGTTPGDYITSVVLENQDAIPGTGGVALNQIVRHALAVSISVPGPRFPALTITSAAHSVLAGHSVVAVLMNNPGNARLALGGDARIYDASGSAVNRSQVAMGSFYAVTSTHVEVVLARVLSPGHYTIVLALKDPATGLSVTSEHLPFEVAAASAPIPILSAAPGQPAAGTPIWELGLVMGAALLLGAMLILLVQDLLRRRPSEEPIEP